MGSVIVIMFTLFTTIFLFANLLFGCGSKRKQNKNKVETCPKTVETVTKKEEAVGKTGEIVEKTGKGRSDLMKDFIKPPDADTKKSEKKKNEDKKSQKSGSNKKETDKKPAANDAKQPEPKGSAPPVVNKPDSKANIITDPIVTPETDEYPTVEEEKKTEDKPVEEVGKSNKDKKK